jgi:uncharacterized membrane protein YkvA (DUF1232 family)
MTTEPSRDLKQKVRDLLLFLPRMVKLLGRIAADPEVSGQDKALVLGALAYLASPIDLIPDFIPVIGELDDIYLVALVLLRLMNRVGPKKLQAYWDGPEDIVALVQRVSELATAILPERIRRLVMAKVDQAEQAETPGPGEMPGPAEEPEHPEKPEQPDQQARIDPSV